MTSKMLLSLVALIMMLIFRVSAQQEPVVYNAPFHGQRYAPYNTEGACTSNPCANGGTCVTTATGFTCNCQPYSMGPKCEQDRDQCQDDPCPENEVCTDLLWRFECSCPEGFSGGGTEPCIEVDECKTYPCHVDALCNNLKGSHTCTCKPGYTGDGTNECTLCETCTVSPCAYLPCKNGGTCREEGESYTCDCTYKYTGDTCDSELLAPCSLLPCGNGGTCTDNADFTDYTCACVHPYTGTNCESVIPCSTAPCLNSGTCTNSGSGYTCTCTNKYTGTNCESVVQCTNSLCKNGGVCTNDGDLGTFSCTCTTGYRGPLCESASQGACAGGPCLHGDCSESNVEPGFKCSCYDGYTGYTCKHGLTPTVATTVTTTPTTTTTTTTTTLPPTTTTVAITTTASPGACAGGPCLHGDCSISNVEPGFKCSCYDGYMGYTCKQDVNECERTSYPCHAKATCSNSVGSYDCTCKAGYAGDGKSCTDVDECGTVSCPENRECMNTPGSYLCKCKPGYTKSETQNCQPNPHLGLCKATPCKNGGTCIGLVQNQPCVCIATTSGPFCEIDACTSKPCMHDGICSLDGETYRCACVGYTGDNCETEITTTTTTTTTMPPTTSAPSTITVASCSAIADNKRTNCGYSGVGKMQCEKINCCWDTSVQGVPWCFLRTVATTPPSAAKCAQAKRNGQFNCAVNFNNINGDLCTARGCCWDPLTASGPPCYYVELPYETTTTTTTTTTVPTTTTTTLPTTTVALASACASSPCVNGECSNSENQLGYICKCNNGFSGDTCEEASCSAIANNKRTNCGFSGVDKTQCEKIGCCWDTSLRGVPWCFLRIVATTPPPADKCLEAKRNGQFNCAVNFDNIDGDLCTARGCCWDPLTASGPPCYYVELPYTTTTIATTTTAAPTTTTTPPTTTLEMCGEALCDPHATCALNHTCLCNEDLGFKESDTDPTKCVARCPIGQSYDIETVACESCPLGTYGDVDLGSACNSCAANETTKTTGSVGRASCKVVCDLGSYNNDGACDLCPKATFKAVVDLEPCEPCPTGQSTSSLGSTTSTNCVDPCAPGQFISRYGEGDRCLLCPLNTFSTTGDWGECESCPPSYKTASTGATSGQQCMDPCKLTPPYCENEGICRVEPDTGIKCYCAFDKTGTRCTLPKTALLSLNPPYGPEAGGTAVTIRGRNFNATLNTAVHFGIYPCKVKSRSEDEIVCTTAPVTEDEIAFFKRVILSWSNGESKTFDNTFNYRPNPTITDIRPLKTILSGGTAMTVKGTNFYSVKNPFLAVHLLFAERTIFRSEFHCTEIDAVIMICRTPKITLSSTVKNDLGISDAQGSSRKKRETGDGALVSSTNKVHQRVRREADNNEAINERHTTAKFALLVYFDGHKVNYTEQQKTYLNVYVDPSFEPLSGLIYFRPFWPINDERIEIKAAKIPMALKHEVVVIIGNAECRKQEVYSNLIVCHPPSRRPSKGMDSMGRSLVAVKVGDLESSVGIMKYEHNLWEYPPGRSAILGGLASVIFFAIVIICCVMCCRRRRQKRKPPPPYSPPASPSGRQYETFHSNQSEAHSLHSLKFATARRFDSRRHSMHGSVQGSIASKLSGRQRRDSESDSDGDDLPRDLPV